MSILTGRSRCDGGGTGAPGGTWAVACCLLPVARCTAPVARRHRAGPAYPVPWARTSPALLGAIGIMKGIRAIASQWMAQGALAADLPSCSCKTVGQEQVPSVRDPAALLRGNLCRGTCGVRRRTRLRAGDATLEQPRRVRSRSGCVLRHSHHPASTTPQARPQGGGDGYHSGHRCARHEPGGSAVCRWFNQSNLLRHSPRTADCSPLSRACTAQ